MAKLYSIADDAAVQRAYKEGKHRAIKKNRLVHLFFTDDLKYLFVSILPVSDQIHGMFYPGDGKWEEIRWDYKRQVIGKDLPEPNS